MSGERSENSMIDDTKPDSSSGGSWISSSLLQISRPITDLAAKLGILTGGYEVIEENEQLKDMLKKAGHEDTVFVSLHVLTNDDDDTKINQIGISLGPSDKKTQSYCVQAQIDAGVIVKETSLPQRITCPFIFGETEVIAESDIDPWLDYFFRPRHQPHETICLIGYDIRRSLRLIEPYLKIPAYVNIIDTRAIQESHDGTTSHPSLEQTLEGVMGQGSDGSLLESAGNITWYILELLQDQALQAEEKKKESTIYLTPQKSPSW